MCPKKIELSLCSVLFVMALCGCGTTAPSGSTVDPIDSQVTVPQSTAGSLETPKFEMASNATATGGGSPTELTGNLDLEAQTEFNPYTVDPTVDNPTVPGGGSGQTVPVGMKFAEAPTEVEFDPNAKPSGTEYVDSWMKNNKPPASVTAVTPPEVNNEPYVDSWMKNKKPPVSGTAVKPPEVSNEPYVDSWMKNKKPPVSGTAVTPPVVDNKPYVDSWMKPGYPGVGGAPVPETKLASIQRSVQSQAQATKYDPAKDPNRPKDFGQGGFIHRAQQYWDTLPSRLEKEVEEGRMEPLEATLKHTGGVLLGGFLRYTNFGNVEKAAGELGYDVGAGASQEQLLKDGLKLTGHSVLAGASALPVGYLGKSGTILRGKNAGKFDEVIIHVKPEQFDKIRKGGGLIPTAEGRIFGTQYSSLYKPNGKIDRIKQIGSGLTNPAARVDKVVLRGDVLKHFERITPGGVIGASKHYGGQIVSSKIGHNLKFNPRHMFQVNTKNGGRELIVFKGEMEKAAFKQYLWAQSRQAGTVVKEGALTAPPIVMATDYGIEYFTGEENVILRPAYEATNKGVNALQSGYQKVKNGTIVK